MAIYNCPKCNKRYFLDDKEQNSVEFQREFKCEFCGTGYKGITVKQSEPTEDNAEAPNVSQSQNNTTPANAQTVSDKSAEWELLLKIERKQLETLDSIKGMMKFFTILTCINIIASIIMICDLLGIL